VTAPKVVCLCGSVRFADTFKAEREAETLAGRIVVGPEILDTSLSHSNGTVKRNLDELHLRKIDIADEVYVLNVNGYVGESTRREIAYAVHHGKPVRYLETHSQAVES
jgi:hypothetical protein